MYKEVWGVYRPQSWGYDVTFTPQVTLMYQICGQFGPCNSIRVQPYALEAAYQCLKLFIYMSSMDVWRVLRWVLASILTLWYHFHSSSDPDVPNLRPTWPMKQYNGATICPWDSVPMLNSHHICLIWMYEEFQGGYQASIMTLWYHFHSTSLLEFKNLGPTWQV